MGLGELDVVVSWEVPQETRASTAEGKDGLICIAAYDQQLCIRGQAGYELACGGIQ